MNTNVKAGSALRFGLTTELPEYIRKCGKENIQMLSASLVYLCLRNVINSKKTYVLYSLIRIESIGEEAIDRVLEKVNRVLLYEFKKKFEFRSFEELIEQLDQYTIPEWCFEFGDMIINYYLNNLILANDMLYFIGGVDYYSEVGLLRISTDYLKKDIDLTENDNTEMVLSGFDGILGFDEKLNRIFLKIYNQENYYAYYDILDKRVVICKDRFHSFASDNLFVIKNDSLAIVTKDNAYPINEYKEYENYETGNNCFYVKPYSNYYMRFFYPYVLYFDGKKADMEREEVKKILWDYMAKNYFVPQFYMIYWGVPNDSPEMPDNFTINEVLAAFDKLITKQKQCIDEDYILIEKIFEIIARYVDKDADITRLLYVLCEASSILNDEGRFPSEELYMRLKTIEFENNNNTDLSLGTLIHNESYDALLHAIVEDDSSNTKDLSRIGAFSFTSKGLKTFPVNFEDGVLIGSLIIPQTDLSHVSGIVTYDARLMMFYVTCGRDMTSDEKRVVIEDFGLYDENITFVKQDVGGKEDESFSYS